jgi:putative FmdB family regulatory protein
MPLYEYQCENCGDVFELIQKFSDEPLSVHEKCGGPVHRLISAPALQFKGSGWYVNDYAKGGSNGGKKDGDGGKKDGDSGNSSGNKEGATASSSDSKDSKGSDKSSEKSSDSSKASSSSTPASSTPAATSDKK